MGMIGRAPPVKAILHLPSTPIQSGSKSFLKFRLERATLALFRRVVTCTPLCDLVHCFHAHMLLPCPLPSPPSPPCIVPMMQLHCLQQLEQQERQYPILQLVLGRPLDCLVCRSSYDVQVIPPACCRVRAPGSALLSSSCSSYSSLWLPCTTSCHSDLLAVKLPLSSIRTLVSLANMTLCPYWQ